MAERSTTGDWTASCPSGWCMMNLHGWADDQDRIEDGYCRLDSTKCDCPCHRGEDVERKRAWQPPSPLDEIEDDDNHEAPHRSQENTND